MVDVFSNTKIYILCPSNVTAGGTESLHQVACKLRSFRIDAKMVFYPDVSNPTIHAPYKKYKPVITDFIEDTEHNVLIIPEIFIHPLLDQFKKIRKIIWWLST